MNVWEMALLARSEIKSDRAKASELEAYAERRQELVDVVGPKEARRLLVQACEAPVLTDAERGRLLHEAAKEEAAINAAFVAALRAKYASPKAPTPKTFGPSVYIALRNRAESLGVDIDCYDRAVVARQLHEAATSEGLAHLRSVPYERKLKIYDAVIASLRAE